MKERRTAGWFDLRGTIPAGGQLLESGQDSCGPVGDGLNALGGMQQRQAASSQQSVNPGWPSH